MSKEEFYEISPADFFYRNKDLAGFSNPARALYSTVRELVENSFDACELHSILPDIYLRISHEGAEGGEGVGIYAVRVADNGSGIPARHIPHALAQVFYGSKYRLRQSRGTFGLGGTMAILYGQITTNNAVHVISSTGTPVIHEYELLVDIQRNKPVVLKHRTYRNDKRWHGTVIEIKLDGDYLRAGPKILEYLKQTAIVTPYAKLTFVDPKGRLYRFERVASELPSPPKETKPHPYGSDVETVKRIISGTTCKDMLNFMTTHFHRVGPVIAKRFLESAGIPPSRRPNKLSTDEVVKLVQHMKCFPDFRPPTADCLSPLGEDLLRAGIKKELNPEFVSVKQRAPSVYSGFPFIVEVGVAYGGGIPQTGEISLYRFANRIPLLYDESSDVSWDVVHNGINWKHYNVDVPNAPLAVLVHICSTKIPYRSVGKEFIADVPEIRREILNGIRDAARELSISLSRRQAIESEKRRLDVFEKFLPKIAKFSAEIIERNEPPDIRPLLKSVMKYGPEEDRKSCEE
ncbi:MAG: DNA topoisomerase VI subunit B [Candidatus Bathyarchaeia archaeon]